MPVGMTRFWRQAWAVARRDLVVEGRAGEVAGVILPFAAVAVFVVPLATDAGPTRLATLAWPVFWLVALLFGMQVALRQTGLESQTQRRHLALAGLDPVARFAGRCLAASVMIGAVLAVTFPLVVVFYTPEVPTLPPAAGIIGLFSVGLAMLASLAGDVTAGLRTRTVLAPLLVAPLATPLLVGASQGLEALIRGTGTLTWVLLLVVADLVLALTGVVTARSLEDAAL